MRWGIRLARVALTVALLAAVWRSASWSVALALSVLAVESMARDVWAHVVDLKFATIARILAARPK